MSKKLTPIGDRVVIKPISPEEVSSGGLIVPDLGKEKAIPGIVVAVGPGVYTLNGTLIKPVVKEGDTVIYPKFGTHSFQVDDVEYVIIRESELFTII